MQQLSVSARGHHAHRGALLSTLGSRVAGACEPQAAVTFAARARIPASAGNAANRASVASGYRGEGWRGPRMEPAMDPALIGGR